MYSLNFRIYIFILGASFNFMLTSCGDSSSRSITYNKKSLKLSNERGAVKYDAQDIVRDGSYGRSSFSTYDLFMPAGWEGEQPPLLVFAHPGGFIMGDKDDYLIQRMCKEFARLGYATAAINYQLIDVNMDNLSQNQRRTTLMKAVSDARIALKYIQKKHGFKPDKTIFIGYSAGAFIANHIVFTDENEMLNYIDGGNLSSTAFSQPAPTLISGAVAIAGGVLDYNHLDDQDLNDIPLLLIHGTNDSIVPYFRGHPFEKLINSGVDLKLPGLYYELGGSYSGNEFSLKIGRNLVVNNQVLKLVRNLMFPDELCGSSCIAEEYINKPNLQLVSVENGPHTLMHNSEEGDLNQTYSQIKRRIHTFVKQSLLNRENMVIAKGKNGSSRKRRSNRY